MFNEQNRVSFFTFDKEFEKYVRLKFVEADHQVRMSEIIAVYAYNYSKMLTVVIWRKYCWCSFSRLYILW